MATQIAFYTLTALLFATALGVIFAKNPIYSALSMVAAFFCIAGHYILLNAQFLAAVHVIVYAGAIMVLFLFTIMLLNLNKDTEPQHSFVVKAAGVVAGGLMLVILAGALKAADQDPKGLAEVHASPVGLVQALGRELYRNFLVPFEIASVLFLAAMAGAVALGKRETDE